MTDKSKFMLTTFSIVVAASHHNPTLLNPDFLRTQISVLGGVEVDNVITTPPFSSVKYKNGLSITVEPEKLQVLQMMEGKSPEDSLVPEVASRYVETLPHVKYTAVGINWIGYVKQDNPATWIRGRFLANGVWSHKPYDVAAMGIRLSYDVDSGKCNLAISDGQVRKNEQAPFAAMNINVNYHYDLKDKYPNNKDVVGIINKWSERQKHFEKLLVDVLDLEQ